MKNNNEKSSNEVTKDEEYVSPASIKEEFPFFK
jgi:hypothetical protein